MSANRCSRTFTSWSLCVKLRRCGRRPVSCQSQTHHHCKSSSPESTSIMRYRVVTTYLMYLLLVPSLAQELKARVVGGTAVAGRLEIFYDGTWNTVCDRGFGQEEALVACRMLGFNSTTAVAVGSVKYGEGSGPILFGELRCVGHETSLAQCRHSGLYMHYCEHWEDVGVMCNFTEQLKARVVGGTAEAGRLEIFHDGTWNTVCNYRFGQKEALVACRMLGFNSTTAAAVWSDKYGEGSGLILFSNLQCVGNETSLGQCKYWGLYKHECEHWLDVGVACNITQQLKARVVNGTAEAGRLEIFYDGTWNTVCDRGFGQKEALVACRMLGFNSTIAIPVWSNKYGEGSGPILFSNLQCVWNETSLAQCQHWGLYRHNCEHSDDIGVACIFTQQLRARVVGGTAEAGRLEIFYAGTWNTVCGSWFGHEEALVACRMLGFNSTTAVAVGSDKYGAGSGDILFNNLRCVGNETSLALCQHRGLYTHNCEHWEDVGVMCYINPPEMPFLLIDNQTTVNCTTNVNNSVDFTCRVGAGIVESLELLKVTRNGLQIVQGLSTSSPSFRIQKAGCGDSGIYYCRAGNTLGQTNSTSVQLSVLCSPEWASDTLATTTELKVTEGLEGQTTFEVMASPVPTIDGYISHHEKMNSSSQEKPVRSDLFTGKCEQKTPDLHLATCTVYVTQATPTDTGLYSVHVSNSKGAMTVTFQLRVTACRDNLTECPSLASRCGEHFVQEFCWKTCSGCRKQTSRSMEYAFSPSLPLSLSRILSNSSAVINLLLSSFLSPLQYLFCLLFKQTQNESNIAKFSKKKEAPKKF
ncbi:deleted in malignant brain tumors 1 protein-like isoform X2 [Pomacea canaliculata]|uniref:deleted in malignant brain tumors 1 protein-like isoform X2 n=1 Tax=Pomacea canaliculata TaxID=400727 RepID=UPI000D736C5E|nr:deleted in malignant brain tumors 1 protein-like isoform X2 [Pomacea canaliculata]